MYSLEAAHLGLLSLACCFSFGRIYRWNLLFLLDVGACFSLYSRTECVVVQRGQQYSRDYTARKKLCSLPHICLEGTSTKPCPLCCWHQLTDFVAVLQGYFGNSCEWLLSDFVLVWILLTWCHCHLKVYVMLGRFTAFEVLEIGVNPLRVWRIKPFCVMLAEKVISTW